MNAVSPHSSIQGAPDKRVAIAARDVRIPPLGLGGKLRIPAQARALVVFAHGSGSSRLSPRNIAVSKALNARGLATLLFDLLTQPEEIDRRHVFDIPLLADRLAGVVEWAKSESPGVAASIGLFGASTGAAAALAAAAVMPEQIGAVVSRGGRPDLAGSALEAVQAPTLLIVGGADRQVLALNEQALARIAAPKSLVVVPGASHLFPEAGALEAVIDHAARWFEAYLLPAGLGDRALARGFPGLGRR